MYSVFRIHSGRLSSQWHIVFGFSHTFGSLPFAAAHCSIVLGFSHTFSSFTLAVAHCSIVLGFSHTFSSFTLAVAHCTRFFAYIRVACPRSGTLYSVFRIHLARLPSQWYIVFGFSHTFGSFPLAYYPLPADSGALMLLIPAVCPLPADSEESLYIRNKKTAAREFQFPAAAFIPLIPLIP
jgi:hypothetical protein